MDALFNLAPWIIALGAFAAVAGLGQAIAATQRPLEAPGPAVGPAGPPLGEGLTSALGGLAAPGREAERGALRRILIQAGYRGRHALETFAATRAGLALGLPILGWLLIRPGALVWSMLLGLVLATAGYYLPWLEIRRRQQNRRMLLDRALPNALDLLVSALEAGQAVDAALIHVTREMRESTPELARELDQVNNELRAGVPRLEALRHLSERTGVEEVISLVNVLAQADRFGTGIAQSIRAHAQLSRRRRALDAERRAAEAAPKLTVAMVVFILPAIFVVLVGPTIVNIVEHLLPTLRGEAP